MNETLNIDSNSDQTQLTEIEFDRNIQSICVNDEISSYDYSHRVTEFINKHGVAYSNILAEYLKKNIDLSNPVSIDDSKKNIQFTVYYLLCYYYKHYNKVDSMRLAIASYDAYFEYAPLHNEVKSWYYRLTGDLAKALKIDKVMMHEIDITINAVPYVSYASSVAKILEWEKFSGDLNGKKFWKSNDERVAEWKAALKAILDTISQYEIIRKNQHYGKHYAIYGQLLSLNPELENMSLERAEEKFQEAEKYVLLAIQNENENAEEYAVRCQQYYQIQNRIALQRISLLTKIYKAEIYEQLDKLSEKENSFAAEMENRNEREIGLLSIFSAIISLIISGISITTQMQLVEGVILFALVTFACVFLCAFCMMMYLSKPGKIVALVMSMVAFIFIVALIGVSLFLRINGIL